MDDIRKAYRGTHSDGKLRSKSANAAYTLIEENDDIDDADSLFADPLERLCVRECRRCHSDEDGHPIKTTRAKPSNATRLTRDSTSKQPLSKRVQRTDRAR